MKNSEVLVESFQGMVSQAKNTTCCMCAPDDNVPRFHYTATIALAEKYNVIAGKATFP